MDRFHLNNSPNSVINTRRSFPPRLLDENFNFDLSSPPPVEINNDPLAVDYDSFFDDPDEFITNLEPIEQIFLEDMNHENFLPESDNYVLNGNKGLTANLQRDKPATCAKINVVISPDACDGIDLTEKISVVLLQKNNEQLVLDQDVTQYVVIMPKGVKGFNITEKNSRNLQII